MDRIKNDRRKTVDNYVNIVNEPLCQTGTYIAPCTVLILHSIIIYF